MDQKQKQNLLGSIKHLKSALATRRQRRKALLLQLPNEAPSSRHPFDPKIQAAYSKSQHALPLRAKELPVKLPPQTPKVRLPLPLVKPPVTS